MWCNSNFPINYNNMLLPRYWNKILWIFFIMTSLNHQSLWHNSTSWLYKDDCSNPLTETLTTQVLWEHDSLFALFYSPWPHFLLENKQLWGHNKSQSNIQCFTPWWVYNVWRIHLSWIIDSYLLLFHHWVAVWCGWPYAAPYCWYHWL